MTKLLIVESPGKIKTLRKILGSGWDIQPSVGHITELANDGEDSLGFDLGEDRITCRYLPRKDRGKEIIQKLRSAAQRADEIYLATDPDREGEAIAWHIAQQLKLSKPKRVVYTQITDNAVKKAIASPRLLDEDLINAQRCRQCLDKLVGYKVSPLLWNSTGGKSAGRVQSATLHLVCEREREIRAFQPTDYWSVWVEYQEGFKAFYSASELPEQPAPEAEEADDAKDDTAAPESARVLSVEAADNLVAIAKNNPHHVVSTEGKTTQKAPPPPFVTSSLQQAAGSQLGLNPEKTMSIAQSLYEGVELPTGPKGLITYMRTDDVTLSPEFIDQTRSYLSGHDPENLPEKATRHRSKDSAQAAHEAIRPTDINLTPAYLKPYLNADEYRLYDLIWRRALASQCAPAKLVKTRIITRSGPVTWEAKAMIVAFPGYTTYWNNLDKESSLPVLTQGQALTVLKAEHEMKQTQPPSRYTEPRLVQLMERKRIGRPSTYASTLKTLKTRQYLELKGKVLHPTELGMSTDDVLGKALPDLIETRFTADMEAALDAIADGKNQWERYLLGWNRGYLVPALQQAHQVIAKQYATRPSGSAGPRLFNNKDLPRSRTRCPECNNYLAKITSKKVKKGYFLKCVDTCPDLVMFWSEREKKWETPKAKPTASDATPKPAPKITMYPCPVCKSPLEEFGYMKAGQEKSLLRCSNPKARDDKKHKDVAFFQSRGVWWSPKFGELPPA